MNVGSQLNARSQINVGFFSSNAELAKYQPYTSYIVGTSTIHLILTQIIYLLLIINIKGKFNVNRERWDKLH